MLEMFQVDYASVGCFASGQIQLFEELETLGNQNNAVTGDFAAFT